MQKCIREIYRKIAFKTLVIINGIWYNRFCYKHAEVAQSVEQLIRNQQVAGSIPVFSTNQNVAILMVVAFFYFCEFSKNQRKIIYFYVNWEQIGNKTRSSELHIIAKNLLLLLVHVIDLLHKIYPLFRSQHDRVTK